VKPKYYILDDNCDMQALARDNDCYIIARDGIYHKLKTSIYNYVLPLDNLRHLKGIKTFAHMNIPKLSIQQMKLIIKFFHDVYKTLQSEVMVLLYYNYQTQHLDIRTPPEQVVSGGSIQYQFGPPRNDGYILIGSIHSHGSMGAFHSGTDKHDETSFDGLHITIGQLSKDDYYFTFSSQLVVNGHRQDYPVDKWLDGQFEKASREIVYKNYYAGGYYGYRGNMNQTKQKPATNPSKVVISGTGGKTIEISQKKQKPTTLKDFLYNAVSVFSGKQEARQSKTQQQETQQSKTQQQETQQSKTQQHQPYHIKNNMCSVGDDLSDVEYPLDWEESVIKYAPQHVAKKNIDTNNIADIIDDEKEWLDYMNSYYLRERHLGCSIVDGDDDNDNDDIDDMLEDFFADNGELDSNVE